MEIRKKMVIFIEQEFDLSLNFKILTFRFEFTIGTFTFEFTVGFKFQNFDH